MSREQSASRHIEYAQDRIRQTCLDRDPAAFVECVKVEIISAQDHSRAESDLDAQQDMALWAKIMTFASLAGVCLTGLGIYLVWGTLSETRKATRAAQEAVFVTREIGEKQVRAYLSITSAHITKKDRLAIFVAVKNNGQSPATNIRVNIKATINDEHGSDVIYRYGPKSVASMASGEDRISEHQETTISADAWKRISAFEVYYVVEGVATYRDVFGVDHSENFRFSGWPSAEDVVSEGFSLK